MWPTGILLAVKLCQPRTVGSRGGMVSLEEPCDTASTAKHGISPGLLVMYHVPTPCKRYKTVLQSVHVANTARETVSSRQVMGSGTHVARYVDSMVYEARCHL